LQVGAVILFGRESFTVYRVLVGKPDGKIPLGTPRCRWEDNIKKGLEVLGWGVVCISLA
jgi:hypothetical protein